MSARTHGCAVARRILLLAALTPVSRAPAQAAVRYVAMRDLLVDGATADIGKAGLLTVTRGGELLVADSKDDLIRSFAANGTAGTIGRRGEGPGEFRNLTRIGVIGDSVWALDPGLNRVTLFGPDHKMVRSFLMPATVTPVAGTHDSSEVASEVYVQAMLSDGTLRAIVSFRPHRRPSWANDVDSGYTLSVRITPAGLLKGRIAVFPPNPCYISFVMPHGQGMTSIPFCAAPVLTDWDGTSSVASAVTAPTGAPRYQLTLLGETGEKRFQLSLPFTPVPVSRIARDSSEARFAKMAKDYGPEWANAAPKLAPAPNYPPVRRLLIGRDQTVWVEERLAAPGHHWRVFDAKGNGIGSLDLPGDVAIHAADRNTIWCLVTDSDGLEGVARYHLERAKG